MTLNEARAFFEGMKTAATLATAAAIGIEARPGAEGLRQRSAIAALRELSDTIRAEIEKPTPASSPMNRAFALIAEQEGEGGEVECPMCQGRLQWARLGLGRNVQASCDTIGCMNISE